MTKKKPKQDPANRTQFPLSADKWEQFQAALDTPVRDMPRLRALLDPIQPNLAECLEELARAARRHLADPQDKAGLDRLSTGTADAFAVLHDAPLPTRVITVAELLAGNPVVTVGTDPGEAAIPYYNRPTNPTPEDQTVFAEGILNTPPMASALQRALARRRDNLGDPDPWTALGRVVKVT